MADNKFYEMTTAGPIPGARYIKAGQGLYEVPGFGMGTKGRAYREQVVNDLADARRRGGDAEVRKLAESDPAKYGSESVNFYSSMDTAKTWEGRFASVPEYNQDWLNAQHQNPWAYSPWSVEWGGKVDPYIEALYTAFNNAKNMTDTQGVPTDPAAQGEVVAAPVVDPVVAPIVPDASVAPANSGMAASDSNPISIENSSSSMDLELAAQLAEQERARQLAESAALSTLLGTTSNNILGG